MEFFDYKFTALTPSFLEDLSNLEREGAIYSQFWRDDVEDFRFCRIKFTPKEIVNYVEAIKAFDEFVQLKSHPQNYSAKDALNDLSNTKIKRRVEAYNEWVDKIGQDTAYCFAAFLGDHLENLVCGGLDERYEFLSETYDQNRKYILTEILELFPESVSYLKNERGSRPNFELTEELDVRDLLFSIIKPVFPDSRIEESTSKFANKTKQVDIVVPQISTLIEIKFVRDSRHSKTVANELMEDIEGYQVHENCDRLIAYVWDPQRLVTNRENFINDLKGLREKNGRRFNVEVFIKP